MSLGLVVVEITHQSVHLQTFGHNWLLENLVVGISALLSLLAFIIGLVGYQANFIQLGLDQLFEAPSQYLGLFIHYATWAFHSGAIVPLIVIPVLACAHLRNTVKMVASLMFTFILVILLVISYWKRRWFYSEPGQHNPYKTVYNLSLIHI